MPEDRISELAAEALPEVCPECGVGKEQVSGMPIPELYHRHALGCSHENPRPAVEAVMRKLAAEVLEELIGLLRQAVGPTGGWTASARRLEEAILAKAREKWGT